MSRQSRPAGFSNCPKSIWAESAPIAALPHHRRHQGLQSGCVQTGRDSSASSAPITFSRCTAACFTLEIKRPPEHSNERFKAGAAQRGVSARSLPNRNLSQRSRVLLPSRLTHISPAEVTWSHDTVSMVEMLHHVCVSTVTVSCESGSSVNLTGERSRHGCRKERSFNRFQACSSPSPHLPRDQSGGGALTFPPGSDVKIHRFLIQTTTPEK